MKPIALFILHLFNGTVATLAAAIYVRKLSLMVYMKTSGHHGLITTEIQSFLPAILIVGALAGFITYSRVGGKSAMAIFLVPASVLLVKMLTFPSIVFDSSLAAGWRYFFGPAQCSAHSLQNLAYTASQCLNRLIYVGAVCASLAYSAGALIANMKIWQQFSQKLKESGAQHS